jgi:glycosyltransferase involved in cell wall biosynthesis
MSIVEALGLGVPVVISENCHFPDVTAAGAGTVVPLDPTAVAQALIALATNMERRARAGEAARKLIVDRFLWPEIAAQTITIYKNLRR